MITKYKAPCLRSSPLQNGNPSYDASVSTPHIRQWYDEVLASSSTGVALPVPSAIVTMIGGFLHHPFGVGDLIECRDPFGKYYVCAPLCHLI